MTSPLQALGATRIARGPSATTRTNAALLTARQRDVLDCVAEGLPNAAIGRRLVISPKTVDHHVSAILRKLHVHDRDAAVDAARRLGLSVPGSRDGEVGAVT
jgi:DNA-binding NarL/FixJ family response regulator